MYLTFDQVILVRDQRKVRQDDPIVYERELHGQRVLTMDGGPSRHAGPARQYGRIYTDSADRLCVVPDQWSDDDAAIAKMVV